MQQAELTLDAPTETPRQAQLRTAAKQWRAFAETASPDGLRRVSLATAASLEREAEDGIARCVCCGKEHGRGMWG